MATEKQDVMDERFFVAIGRNCYGKGLSLDEAKRSARRYGHGQRKFRLFKMAEGAHSIYVNDMGSLRWQGTTEQPEELDS